MSSCRGEPESEESDEEESDDILYGSSPESRMVLRPLRPIPIAHVARPFSVCFLPGASSASSG